MKIIVERADRAFAVLRGLSREMGVGLTSRHVTDYLLRNDQSFK